MDEIRRPLVKRMSAVPGLLGMVVHDRDGAVLIKVLVDEEGPEAAMVNAFTRVSFLSSYRQVAESTERLLLGPNESTVMVMQRLVLLHTNFDPVTLTLLANPDECVMGHMMMFSKSLESFVKDCARICIRE